MPDRTMSDADALAAIHQAFDGEEWSSDTQMRVAEILTATGRQVRSPGDHERNDMWLMFLTLRGLVNDVLDGYADGRKRLHEQIEAMQKIWLAMSIDNDDVPVLPLEPSPDDGPGCMRDARGRRYYSSEFQ